MKTLRIELKVNFHDREKFLALKEMARRCGQELLAGAALINDGSRQPQLTMLIEGAFESAENIEITTEDEESFEEVTLEGKNE